MRKVTSKQDKYISIILKWWKYSIYYVLKHIIDPLLHPSLSMLYIYRSKIMRPEKKWKEGSEGSKQHLSSWKFNGTFLNWSVRTTVLSPLNYMKST